MCQNVGLAETIRGAFLTVVVFGLRAEISRIPLVIFINRGLSPAKGHRVLLSLEALVGICKLKNFAYLHIMKNIFPRDDKTQNGAYHTVFVNTARLFKGMIWLVKVKTG